MASNGRRRTPTQILAARGSWVAKTRKCEPVSSSGEFDNDVPVWLTGDGAKMWFDIVPRLTKAGIVGELDMGIVATYCFWWGKFMSLVRDCPNDTLNLSKATEQITKLGARLGLNPSDRSALHVDNGKSDNRKDTDCFKVG